MRTILHGLFTAGLFIFLWIMFPVINFTGIIPGIFLALTVDVAVDPEAGPMSLKMYLSHSTVIWIVTFIFNPMALTALIVLAISLHCLMDIYPGSPDVPRTKYNSWLFGNGMIGVVLFLLYIISSM